MGDDIKYKIKGHEKFVLREGWLTKGLLSVKNNSLVFSGDKGPDELGVGSNMVKAIRYYMQAFQLVNENSKKGTTLTVLGEAIADFDPYLEDRFTLCLLHSLIASNFEKATSWYLFFNQSKLKEFSKDNLQDYISREILRLSGKEVPESSIKDDIDVLLNMYLKKSGDDDIGEDPEDKLHSPLSSLGLIRREKNTYFKQQIDLKLVGTDTILYEISNLIGKDKSLSIEAIANHLENYFGISWVQTNEYLDVLDREGIIRVDRTAGLDVIYPIEIPTAEEIIVNHYKGRE